ncbi:hypothetical protein DFH08DRAFT_974347 [Mycena albidolilacea]|uniref:Uncharacterized protein n=1 Tax=Mycena albidolilacea TaxID=1033008 RepID=A0AAD6Z7J1_9AGAR|nr:hypothetical protein DFH08DRAFT_974347 [Mycena albidolilacea]
MSEKPKTSRGPYDPVFDHPNPNPIIDRAVSTQQATRMETAASMSGPSGPASSSSSSPRHGSSGRPKSPKMNNSMPTKTPAETRSSVLAPLAARVGLQNPTAASVAKGAAAPASKHVPFDGVNLRMPSHMTNGGKRRPPPCHDSMLGTEETRPECVAPVAAPGKGLPLLAGETTALPGMSVSPPLALLPENAQHSSTEPSEESDLGPFHEAQRPASISPDAKRHGYESSACLSANLPGMTPKRTSSAALNLVHHPHEAAHPASSAAAETDTDANVANCV